MITNMTTQNITVGDRRTLRDIGRGNHVAIPIQVKGYWSDAIRLYVHRDWNPDVPKWSVEINHSTSGRVTKEVLTDAEAVKYFAEGLVTASLLAEYITANSHIIEQYYQEKLEEQRRQEQAAIDADPPMGVKEATVAVDMLLNGDVEAMKLYTRGAQQSMFLETRTWRSKKRLVLNGERMTRDQVIGALSVMSSKVLITRRYEVGRNSDRKIIAQPSCLLIVAR